MNPSVLRSALLLVVMSSWLLSSCRSQPRQIGVRVEANDEILACKGPKRPAGQSCDVRIYAADGPRLEYFPEVQASRMASNCKPGTTAEYQPFFSYTATSTLGGHDATGVGLLERFSRDFSSSQVSKDNPSYAITESVSFDNTQPDPLVLKYGQRGWYTITPVYVRFSAFVAAFIPPPTYTYFTADNVQMLIALKSSDRPAGSVSAKIEDMDLDTFRQTCSEIRP